MEGSGVRKANQPKCWTRAPGLFEHFPRTLASLQPRKKRNLQIWLQALGYHYLNIYLVKAYVQMGKFKTLGDILSGVFLGK